MQDRVRAAVRHLNFKRTAVRRVAREADRGVLLRYRRTGVIQNTIARKQYASGRGPVTTPGATTQTNDATNHTVPSADMPEATDNALLGVATQAPEIALPEILAQVSETAMLDAQTVQAQVEALLKANDLLKTEEPETTIKSRPAEAAFENTFAQYQYPQTRERNAVAPATGETTAPTMTQEEEERAADALLQDIDSISTATLPPLEGFNFHVPEEAIAKAIKQLGAEHESAVQQAVAVRVPMPTPRGPAKRFACSRCDKAFARAYNLNTHLATHEADPSRSKPYGCPYASCKSEGGRAFSRKHDLQRHVASIHELEAEPGIRGDDGEDTGGLVSLGLGRPGKKFRCDSCGRSFVRRDALARHVC